MNRRELLGSVGAASLLPSAFAASATEKFFPAFRAAFRLGPVQDGAGNGRWAQIIAGELSGSRLNGRVQSGRMDWVIDPCSGAVEIGMTCSVLRTDGKSIVLRDRTVSASASDRAALPGHPTAPVLAAEPGAGCTSQFVGRLDTTAFWRGYVSLRAFEDGIGTYKPPLRLL
jgi:hypothetical protein